MEINLEFNTNDYDQEDLGVIFKEILKLEELLRNNKIHKTKSLKSKGVFTEEEIENISQTAKELFK